MRVDQRAVRWRVRFSTRRPHWFYAAHTAFIDAETPAQAAADVERAHTTGDTSAEAWETLPTTPEMEAAHSERERRRALWLATVRAGDNPRGLL